VAALSFNLGHGFLRFGSPLAPPDRRRMMATIITAQTLITTLALALSLPFGERLSLAAFDRPDRWLLVAIWAWSVLSLAQVQLQNSLVIAQRAALAYAVTTAYRVGSIASLGILWLWPTVGAAVGVGVGVMALTTLGLAWLARADLMWPRIDLAPLYQLPPLLPAAAPRPARPVGVRLLGPLLSQVLRRPRVRRPLRPGLHLRLAHPRALQRRVQHLPVRRVPLARRRRARARQPRLLPDAARLLAGRHRRPSSA
jgi:hypothetical protein